MGPHEFRFLCSKFCMLLGRFRKFAIQMVIFVFKIKHFSKNTVIERDL